MMQVTFLGQELQPEYRKSVVRVAYFYRSEGQSVENLGHS